MAIEFTPLELTELKPKVAVIGVGGAGGNAVNNMVQAKTEGVEFIAANTDAQALSQSLAKLKIQLGVETTQGLGAGSHPDVGRAAAEEALHQIEDALSGCHMVFITAGMGGGTGTGAAPVIAKAAKAKGILTIAVVTKPFEFEGNRRMKLAEDGIYELQPFVDTLVVIPNQNLFRVANKQTTFAEAFEMADDVLCSGVSGITDLMMHPGLINLDFADIKTIMQNMGTSMLGTGEATGENRALEAAETAISNPLLDEMSLASAKGVIINITGGNDLTLFEVDEAANHIRKEVDENANIILGSSFHSDMDGVMRVSIVATGVTYVKRSSTRPNYRDDVAAGENQATNLHFEVDADQAADTSFEDAGVAASADDQAPQEHSEVVGVVDDFIMPEAASIKETVSEFDAPQREADPEAEADFIEAVGECDDLEAPAPGFAKPDEGFAKQDQGFAMKEMHREVGDQLGEPSVFDDGHRRNLLQESLEFIADEEDPPLIEEPADQAHKKSLFSRMTSGIKGVFGGSGQTTQERAEPSMQGPAQDPEIPADGIAEDEDMDNILSIDSRDEGAEDTVVPEAEAVENKEEEIEDDDQLAIPSFLRKQA